MACGRGRRRGERERESVGRRDVGEWRPRVTLTGPCRGERRAAASTCLFICVSHAPPASPPVLGVLRGGEGTWGLCGWRVLQDKAWDGELPERNDSIEMACAVNDTRAGKR